MSYSPILVPVVALVAWTLIVMFWMLVARFAYFRRVGITLGKVPRGSRGSNLDGNPDAVEAQWKSHNYNHLMEQPTIFYAICFSLQFLDQAGPINIGLAWSYVVLRVVHSLVQNTFNNVMARFGVFVLSTLALMALTFHAALTTGLAWLSLPH